MGTIISWMVLGRSHRNKTTYIASVRWEDDYETLVHNVERIRIHEFQRAA